LPEALAGLRPETGWRFWSAREAGVHDAVYRLADMASLDAALKSNAYKALAVDFDRSWPAVTRTRDVLDLVQEADVTQV
jgi:hypothetical protein